MSMPGRWRHALVGLVVLLAGTQAAPASASAGAVWAWVTVRTATGDSLVSGPIDAGSWNAGGAGVHRVDTGHYQVTFYGAQQMGSGADVALVSPMGTTPPRTCAVVSWERVTDSEVVEVKCQKLDGTAIDSRFIVHWLAASGVGGRLAYGFNWSPTSGGNPPDEAYDSTGGAIAVHPDGEIAELRFGSQGVDGGVAIVSATDGVRFTAGSFPTSCSLTGLTTVLDPHSVPNPADDTIDKYVDVKCWEIDGQTNIYHQHVVVFMKGLGLKGVLRKKVAYLVARKPSAASYTPAALDRYSSSGGRITVHRLGTGRYDVTFGGMPRGGGAQVTAFNGAERRVCTIAGISTATTPPHVRVACFDGSGAPRDTRFTLAYTR
jgi:hypothetical protein